MIVNGTAPAESPDIIIPALFRKLEKDGGQSAPAAIPSEANQAVTAAPGISELSAVAPERADQSASTAIVLYKPIESGQFAQIRSKSYLLNGFSAEAVENMTDERLDRFINGHLAGYIQNLTALAEGLSEKKKRLACKGRDGEWSAFVRQNLKRSVSWADRLVRNWDLYLKFGPRIRTAAERAGANINKPSVKALLQSYNDESLLSGEPSEKRFEAWVEELKTAAKRRQNSPQDEKAAEPDAGDSDTDSIDDNEPEQDSDEETDNSSGPKEKTVALHFSAVQAEEFDELIVELKSRMGTQDRPNIVLHALRCLAENFKPELIASKA